MTARWSETQHLAAKWFREHGWPYAEAVGNGRQGKDITGMPGLGPEVKGGMDPERRMPESLRQAEGHGGVPFVISRPRGFGAARVAEWPVTMTMEQFTALAHAAGYGDPDAAAK